MHRHLSVVLVTVLVAAGTEAVAAEAASPPAPDLTQLSLEELMNIEVTTVSRRAERLSQAPAAVHVLTGEDIRRSGATSIPEALRLAPGVQVARLDSHNWAVSARGFNDIFANKLLVLQDGRSIYTPLFSGVFWDQHDVMLEDLDRIEVIRGPGAALWGANAVNGVINIITKSAKETQGMLVSGGGGSEELGFGSARYGGRLGEDAWYRVYGKYFNRDDSLLASGAQADDTWQVGRGGFRIDWEPGDASRLTFSGDFFGGDLHQNYTTVTPAGAVVTIPRRAGLAGGHLLGRWTRTFSEDSVLEAQAYYDRTDRSTPIFAEERHNGDLSVQHRWTPGERHEVSWGLGYRVSGDDLGNTFTVTHSPPCRTTGLFSGFVRDKITLQEDRWWLLLGTHLERNDYTGFEVQPGARLLWTPQEQCTVWVAVSRAVRTPSRAEDDVTINQPATTPAPGSIASFMANRGMRAEEVIAGELGWRWRPRERVSFDFALFHHDYDRVRSVEPVAFTPGPPPTTTFQAGNGIEGETYGVELAPRWQVTDRWRLQAAYSYLRMELRNRPGSADPFTAAQERRSPRHQFSLQSLLDLPRNLAFDWTLRYVDDLPNLALSSYVELDARLAWRPKPDLELALVGQNLLDNQHPEFLPSFIRTTPAEVQRGVYAKFTWRF